MERENVPVKNQNIPDKNKGKTRNRKRKEKNVTRKCCEGGERNSSQAHHKIT